jgi:hypothetical protein
MGCASFSSHHQELWVDLLTVTKQIIQMRGVREWIIEREGEEERNRESIDVVTLRYRCSSTQGQ